MAAVVRPPAFEKQRQPVPVPSNPAVILEGIGDEQGELSEHWLGLVPLDAVADQATEDVGVVSTHQYGYRSVRALMVKEVQHGPGAVGGDIRLQTAIVFFSGKREYAAREPVAVPIPQLVCVSRARDDVRMSQSAGRRPQHMTCCVAEVRPQPRVLTSISHGWIVGEPNLAHSLRLSYSVRTTSRLALASRN